MAVTSGAMIAIFFHGQHLEGQITGRIDADHLERNLAPAASPNLIGRLGIEDLGQLHRLAGLPNSTDIGPGKLTCR